MSNVRRVEVIENMNLHTCRSKLMMVWSWCLTVNARSLEIRKQAPLTSTPDLQLNKDGESMHVVQSCAQLELTVDVVVIATRLIHAK